MLGWIKNLFGRKSAPARQWDRYRQTSRYARLKARYDSEIIDDTDAKHWANMDALSPSTANLHGVRDVLRRKSRYEVKNNSHARGMTLTMANDIIGTGPRLQIMLDDETACDQIEAAWRAWADEIMLAEKLHTFTLASVVDGEGVGLLVNNPRLMNSVKLDVKGIECDQLTTPYVRMMQGDLQTDGIEHDSYGNAIYYHILKHHPGDAGYIDSGDFDRIPARNMLLYFRMDRPGQLRGIPETTPALPIFSQLRRYTLAVLASAEIAADFSLFIKSTAPADVGGDVDVAPTAWSATDVDKGMITALPAGYEPFQLKAEQPTTTHDAFTRTMLREAAHALQVPYNVAMSDYSGDSYAGGRMSLQAYQRAIKVRRKHLALRVLDKIFQAWLDEATRIPGLLPPNTPAFAGSVAHAWFFDGFPHIDSQKEALATQTELQNGTTTLAKECAENGDDWRKVIRQSGKEIMMRRQYGAMVLPPGSFPPGTMPDGTPDPLFTQQGQSETTDNADEGANDAAAA